MPRNWLLPLLIVLFFIAPPAPQATAGPEAAAPSARSSWSGPIQLTNSTNSSWDPSIYVDGPGNIHLAWQDGTDRTGIRYKSFAPSGEVLVNDTVLVDHIDAQPPIYLSSRPLAPRLDFNDGELVLFWNETENHPSGQTGHDESLGMLRFSPDLKSRRDCWLPIFAVDRLYYGNPLYAFDSAGNIHFAYAGNLEWNGEPDVWYVKTNSTGAKLFSRLLAKNQTEVGVAVDKWDQVHLVWRNESGGLTYCRLDENGTERARTQLGWWNNRPAAFTIIASDDYQGASVIQNENSDIHYFWIDYNGTSSGPYYPVFWGNVQPHFDPRTPLSVKSDPRGSTHLFGYGVIDDHTDSNYPYYIVDGFSNGISPPSLDIVQGVNLTDYGYTELGPPFSSFVITRASLGSYVAYSSDRLSWEDPAGGINIYMKRLGPFGPDLLIKDIEFSNPNPLEQDSLAIKISVEYNGTEPLTFFGVELLLDEGMLNFSDEILGPDNKTTVIYMGLRLRHEIIGFHQ